jgi:predicted DNA-binding protein with PD1-like motif
MTSPPNGSDPQASRAGTVAGVGHFGRVLAIRLGPGEDILSATEGLLLDTGISQGVIVSGVASLHHATIRNIHHYPDRWPITTADRTVTTVAGPLEVIAMQGNFAPAEDGLVIHCHLAFSVGNPPAATYGGHLVADTIVATTCELYLAEINGLSMRRIVDDVTGAAEITVESPTR